MPRQLDLPKKIMLGRNSLKSQKNHDFYSKKDIFQVFRPKTTSIKAHDGLKVAPTIAANDVICLVN